MLSEVSKLTNTNYKQEVSLSSFKAEIDELVGDRLTIDEASAKVQNILGVKSSFTDDVSQNNNDYDEELSDYQLLMGVDENNLFGYIDVYFLKTRETRDGKRVLYITETNVEEE